MSILGLVVHQTSRDVHCVEIEFPTHGDAFDRVVRRVALLGYDLAEDELHVQALVRVGGELCSAFCEETDRAESYLYRITVIGPAWTRVNAELVEPLSRPLLSAAA